MSVPIDQFTLNAPESVYGQQPEDPNLALVRAMTELQARQGAMQRAQMVGKAIATELPQDVGTGRYGLGAAMGQIAAAYLTGRQMKKLEAPIAQATSDYALMRQKATDSALRSSNPAAALFGSVDPSLQKLGEAMLEKGPPQAAISPKDLLPYVDPKAIPSLVQSGTAGFQPKPREMKEVGGMLYDPESLTVAQLQGAAPTRVEFQGDLYEQNPTTLQWKKLDSAPKVSVTSAPTINVGGKGNQAYAEGLGKADAERYAKARELGTGAVAQLNTVEDMRRILESGKVFEGPLADIRLQAEGLGSTVGFGNREDVARSRQFDAAVKGMVGELITGSSGRFMTDADAKIIREQGATLTDTAEGKKKVLEIMERTQKRALEAANREIEAANTFKAEQGMPPTELYSLPQQPPFPGTPAPTPSGATMTLDEYLKKNSGGR